MILQIFKSIGMAAIVGLLIYSFHRVQAEKEEQRKWILDAYIECRQLHNEHCSDILLLGNL